MRGATAIGAVVRDGVGRDQRPWWLRAGHAPACRATGAGDRAGAGATARATGFSKMAAGTARIVSRAACGRVRCRVAVETTSGRSTYLFIGGAAPPGQRVAILAGRTTRAALRAGARGHSPRAALCRTQKIIEAGIAFVATAAAATQGAALMGVAIDAGVPLEAASLRPAAVDGAAPLAGDIRVQQTALGHDRTGGESRRGAHPIPESAASRTHERRDHAIGSLNSAIGQGSDTGQRLPRALGLRR